MWWRINRWIFLALLVIFAITYFTRNNYRGVDEINSELYKQPFQVEAYSKEDINFVIGNFEYKLKPLYYYEISGLIVSKKDYSWLSIYKRNEALPVDLCMIWGGNVASKVYKKKGLNFKQGMRFCSFLWQNGMSFNPQEVSNNHLLISNSIINKEIGRLTPGDQVKIIGRLVNVSAKNLEGDDSYDPDYFSLNSSTRREDTGKGACEIIYVEDFEVLKRANPISCFLFKLSILGMLLMIPVNIIRFFIPF